MSKKTSYYDEMWDVLQEDGLTIIDFNKSEDCILCKDKNDRAWFYYKENDFLCFSFDLLSHVNEKYAKVFRRLIKKNGLTIVSVETENDYFDKIVKP